jgi:pimeloyl-ACP methyl ester carboxylesterase
VIAKAGPALKDWFGPVAPTPGDYQRGFLPHPKETEIHDDKARALVGALGLAQMSWSNQGGDVDKLACAVMLPRPGRRLRFKSRRPSLTLDYGSIRARALAAGAKVRAFGVSLFPIARSRNQVKLVDALRSSAIGLRLPRVESLRPADLEGKEGVVIFLHGLMSTDVGTFDAFVHRLQANNALLLASWPHDTLDPIELNAKMLAEHIQRRIGKSGLPLLFVCHSRGGLVARRTAVQLLKASDLWRSRLRGCVTFGTPHEGAELAENADELLGKLLLLRTVKQAGALPLVRALQTVRQFKTLPGITDLRPRKNGGDFLDRLMEAEKDLTGEPGAIPMPVFAVGGRAAANGVAGWLTNRFFDDAPHDLVVALDSSAPEHMESRAEVTSDHFSYFDEPAKGPSENDWTPVVTFVMNAFPPSAKAEKGIPIMSPMVYKTRSAEKSAP